MTFSEVLMYCVSELCQGRRRCDDRELDAQPGGDEHGADAAPAAVVVNIGLYTLPIPPRVPLVGHALPSAHLLPSSGTSALKLKALLLSIRS